MYFISKEMLFIIEMYAYSGVFQFSCSMVSVGGSSLKNAHNYQCYIMKSAANDNVRG